MRAEQTPVVLGVETATRAGSLALLAGERVLWQQAGEREASHSATLLRDLDEGIRQAGVTLRDVDLFAVATGPGSFTGLRTGLATVMGLAWTLDREVAGVGTLRAVARAEAEAGERVVALLPAGRGELFAQEIELTAEKAIRELGAPTHVAPKTLFEREWPPALRWVGEGARRHAEEIRACALRNNVAFVDEAERVSAAPNARQWSLAKASVEALAVHVAALGLRAYREGKTSPPGELRADYVRPSDPELKEQCREQS